MGTPEYGVPTLCALAASHHVAAVVSQPDRPSGRGRRLKPPPVVELARNLGIEIFQPATLRDAAAVEQLAAYGAELFVVAGYGLILPPEVLALPPHGALNVHASLLPRWRGASPAAHAIMAGDERTGSTIMLMDRGLDTGPILAQRSVVVEATDTAGSLTQRLGEVGAQLLIGILPRWLDGSIQPQAQDDTLATFAPALKKTHGWLDWQRPADSLERQVRAMQPWPGAYTMHAALRLEIVSAAVMRQPNGHRPPGEVQAVDSQPGVWTADGVLVLERVQLAGRRPMSGSDFLRGRRGFVGARLTGQTDSDGGQRA